MNDMIKLKQELVDICMLMHDTDAGIGEQARLFLHELHGKDNNQIYNLFPNLVQRLAGMELDEAKFDAIVKTLVEYIAKEKQKEAILEKMLGRLRDGSSQEWRTIAGVLPHLRFTERMLTKATEMYEAWKERMLDQNPVVRDAFLSVIAQHRKLQVGAAAKEGKPLKPRLDDLERLINIASGAVNADQEDEQKEATARNQADEASVPQTGGKKRRQRGFGKPAEKEYDESDEEEPDLPDVEDEDDDDDGEEEEPKPKQSSGAKRPARRTGRTKAAKRASLQESDDGDAVMVDSD